MTAISSVLFTVLVWGAVVLVVVVFTYEMYVILRDGGVISGHISSRDTE
jgi:hypothetical protein